MTPRSLPAALRSTGLMAIVRAPDAATAEKHALALAQGGVRMLEISLTVPDALGAIRRVREALDGEILVGAGTVLDVGSARDAVAAGAGFLVTPAFVPAVADAAAALDVGFYPGALTPREIVEAWRAGATAVKVFPAGSLGPAYLRAIREPLPAVPLLAVGGIAPEEAAGFIAAGAVAVGLGGALTRPGADIDGTVRRLRAVVTT